MNTNIKILKAYVKDKQYLKVLQVLTNTPNNTQELFIAVEAYIGLNRFEVADSLLKEWQFKMQCNYDWAMWLYLKGLVVSNQNKDKHEAILYLNNAKTFLQHHEDDLLLNKINKLVQQFEN